MLGWRCDKRWPVVPEAMRRCFAGCLEAGPAGWAIPPSAPGTPCVSQMPSAFPESRRPAVVLVREIAFHRLQAPGPVEGRELGVLRELLQHVIW